MLGPSRVQYPSATCEKTGWKFHAWCRMDDPFHLDAETPLPNLVVGIKWFLGTDTSRFNRRHQLFGYLLVGRYKSPVIDERGGDYLPTTSDYVYNNPVRASLLPPDQALECNEPDEYLA